MNCEDKDNLSKEETTHLLHNTCVPFDRIEIQERNDNAPDDL